MVERRIKMGHLVPLNDLSRSWIATSEEVRDGVLKVLSSGWYVHGPEHEAFERDLSSFLDVAHVIGVASGTDAIALALQAVGCGPGTEVVTAANAGGYTSVAAARLRCGIVYADVAPEDLVITRATVEAVIGPATRAVVVTHLYGNVADVDSIVAFCHPRGIAVVEDCAQALGAISDGRRTGTIGDVSAFSFYPTKNLGAAGDGGAVATNDVEIAASIRSLRQYGWDRKYHVQRPDGTNSRLDEIQAVILRLGLPRLGVMTARRQSIVSRYTKVLESTPTHMVSGATSASVAHLAVARFPVRMRAQGLFRDLGVATDIHYPIPDHRQPGLPRPVRTTDLPETERATEEILTIPCFPEMTDSEVDRVCDALKLAATP